MIVTDEMVDRAVRAMYRLSDWGAVTPAKMEMYRRRARETLEAALGPIGEPQMEEKAK